VARSDTSSGTIRFIQVADTAFDRFTAQPTPAQAAWMNAHYWRMLTYSPYFDSRLAWFPDAWVYKDLYAIYVGSAVATDHPEWILRDPSGNRLYIRFACSKHTCPQYAADVGDPGFRKFWISEAASVLGKGYRGLYVDDVNLTLSRVSDGSGQPVAPVDPRTGQAMTEADWRRYMAEFCEAIRAAFPTAEIVHNAIWYIGDEDPYVQREVASADLIDLERGVNDPGIRGGTGTYGFDTFLSHIDRVHAQGKSVMLEGRAHSAKAREYGLAAYFLVNSGTDGLANKAWSTPDRWWPAYDLVLGSALGPRYAWSGVLRRDFDGGIVLVNPPGSPPQLLDLGATYTDLTGEARSVLVLRPAQGAVLRKQGS